MAEKIQRVPVGAYSALGIVGSGTGPQELADTVVPVMDFTAFYAARSLEVVLGTNAAAAAVGDAATIDVPPGENWQVFTVSGSISAGFAAQVMAICVGFVIPIGGNFTIVGATDDADPAAAAGDAIRVGLPLPIPFVFNAGSQIRAALMRTPGVGAVNLSVTALIRRLPS